MEDEWGGAAPLSPLFSARRDAKEDSPIIQARKTRGGKKLGKAKKRRGRKSVL